MSVATENGEPEPRKSWLFVGLEFLVALMFVYLVGFCIRRSWERVLIAGIYKE